MKKQNKPRKLTPVQTTKPAVAQEPASPPAKDEQDDDKMDFGGLPDRDLKKNLGGCG